MRLYTEHARQRAIQRNIHEVDVEHTISCGKCFYRQQMLFFVSPDDNLIVVTTNPEIDGDMVVITSYYRKNAMKYVKRKSKRRYKNQAA